MSLFVNLLAPGQYLFTSLYRKIRVRASGVKMSHMLFIKKTQKGNVKLRFYLLPLFALCRRMEHSKISFERHTLAKYPSNFKMGYMYVV